MISPSEKCVVFVFNFVFTVAIFSVSRIWGNGHFHPLLVGM